MDEPFNTNDTILTYYSAIIALIIISLCKYIIIRFIVKKKKIIKNKYLTIY